MNAHTFLRALIPLCAALLTVACGGGYGGGPTVSGIDRTGSPSFGLAFGTISGFGSIIVNGVHYETSSSTFEIDDSPGSQDDLSVGDVVLVQATQASGSTSWTATSVTFDDNVEGPIAAGSLNATAGTFVVLGQTIITNADTSYDNSFANPSFAGLTDGQVVEISGFVNADGAIVATRIEPKPASTEFEVTGLVSMHDGGLLTFMINDLVVDYGAASVRDFPGGVIDDGDLVEVKGVDFDAPSTTLTATDVEFKTPWSAGADGDQFEIEGLITRFVSQGEFDISGLTVDASGAAFEGGLAIDLALNVGVEAEGVIDANGILIADEIEFRRNSHVEIEGLVDSVDSTDGSLVVLGITINVDILTRVEDKRDNVEPFTLANLAAGDFVAIRGSEDPAAAGEIVASRLERDDGTVADTLLQGVVQSSSDPAIVILGVTIDASGAQFRDEADQPITSNAFFTRPPDDHLVKAKGAEVSDMAITATEVQFESEP